MYAELCPMIKESKNGNATEILVAPAAEDRVSELLKEWNKLADNRRVAGLIDYLTNGDLESAIVTMDIFLDKCIVETKSKGAQRLLDLARRTRDFCDRSLEAEPDWLREAKAKMNDGSYSEGDIRSDFENLNLGLDEKSEVEMEKEFHRIAMVYLYRMLPEDEDDWPVRIDQLCFSLESFVEDKMVDYPDNVKSYLRALHRWLKYTRKAGGWTDMNDVIAGLRHFGWPSFGANFSRFSNLFETVFERFVKTFGDSKDHSVLVCSSRLNSFRSMLQFGVMTEVIEEESYFVPDQTLDFAYQAALVLSEIDPWFAEAKRFAMLFIEWIEHIEEE